MMQNFGKTYGVVTKNGYDCFSMFLAYLGWIAVGISCFVQEHRCQTGLVTSNNDAGKEIKNQITACCTTSKNC